MKKIILIILAVVLSLCAPIAYAQKNLMKGLTKAFPSKATSTISTQVERATLGAQVAQQLATSNNALYTRTLYWKTGAPSKEYNGLLTRITLAETLPAAPRPIQHVTVPTSTHVDNFEFTYVPQAPELQLLQDYIQEYQRWPIVGNYPEVLYAFISLVQQDVAGKLTPQDQQQLYKLAMLRYSINNMVENTQKLKEELSYWRQTHRLYGANEEVSPKLVPKEQLMHRYYFEHFADEWYLAAHIYLAQQIYGDQLPEVLQKVNVIPEPKENRTAEPVVVKNSLFYQPGLVILKANQEKFAQARANNQYEKAWDKFMKQNAISSRHYGPGKLEEIAQDVYNFYAAYIGFENLPRVKAVNVPEEKSVVLEIPVNGLSFAVDSKSHVEVSANTFVVLHRDDGHTQLIYRNALEAQHEGAPLIYSIIN